MGRLGDYVTYTGAVERSGKGATGSGIQEKDFCSIWNRDESRVRGKAVVRGMRRELSALRDPAITPTTLEAPCKLQTGCM